MIIGSLDPSQPESATFALLFYVFFLQAWLLNEWTIYLNPKHKMTTKFLKKTCIRFNNIKKIKHKH